MTHEFSICNELRTLGITANYKGYKQAAWAIHLALDDERRLDDISKEIYQPIAQLFFCYINSVERNLRTVSRRAWTLQRYGRYAGENRVPSLPVNAVEQNQERNCLHTGQRPQ